MPLKVENTRYSLVKGERIVRYVFTTRLQIGETGSCNSKTLSRQQDKVFPTELVLLLLPFICVTELIHDTVEIMLMAADKLEKDLIQIVVENSVDSEDGGKSVIRQTDPDEAEAVIIHLVKSWIKTRIDRLKECVGRNVWMTHSNKECFAPVALEILVSSTRIEPFLEELKPCLKIILSAVHTRIISHVITEVVKVCFDGFLLVLSAGVQHLIAPIAQVKCQESLVEIKNADVSVSMNSNISTGASDGRIKVQ
ncbi:hypothetical protein VNO78_30517 [Psophocarpus tetragonolobus]|uniref:MHD1 domain-containing protein n=1 Tax=Psophocarpus tetragonolobus TaxID=3891 RepID=A0AAN9RWR6_PSOTE